jgi:hypothetical protein
MLLLFFCHLCYNNFASKTIKHTIILSGGILMKIRVFVLTLALVTSLLAGCGAKPAAKPAAATPAASAPAATTPAATKAAAPDTVATASVVDNNAAFEKALTATGGKYCIATLKDLTFTKDLVVDGEYKTGKKDANGKLVLDADGKEATQRKIALYTQDDQKKVTGKFTLTAPKITFNSNYGSLEHGTFKGDVYVAGKNFKLVNAKIDGNIYFLNEEAQKTFTIADVAADLDSVKTVVTGKQELKK